MAAILKNGGRIEILRGPRFMFFFVLFLRVSPIGHVHQNGCLYHNLNDFYTYLLR